jgi:hypothetical protein
MHNSTYDATSMIMIDAGFVELARRVESPGAERAAPILSDE